MKDSSNEKLSVHLTGGVFRGKCRHGCSARRYWDVSISHWLLLQISHLCVCSTARSWATCGMRTAENSSSCVVLTEMLALQNCTNKKVSQHVSRSWGKIAGVRESLFSSGRSWLLYRFIRNMMKPMVGIIEAYHFYYIQNIILHQVLQVTLSVNKGIGNYQCRFWHKMSNTGQMFCIYFLGLL